MVETIRGFRRIAPRIPKRDSPRSYVALPDRLVAAADRAFDVPWGLPLVVVQQDVDPARTAHFAGGTSACSFQHRRLGTSVGRVHVPGRGEAAKAEQAVAGPWGLPWVVDLSAVAEARASAIADGRAAEPMRPARPAQSAVALGFGAILLHELEHRSTDTAETAQDSSPRRPPSFSEMAHRLPEPSQMTRPAAEVRGRPGTFC